MNILRNFHIKIPVSKLSGPLALLVIFVIGLPFVPGRAGQIPVQQESQGYWEYVQMKDSDKWLGNKYRGLDASYEAFFNGDYSIGATYQELNPKFPNVKVRGISITEKAVCSISGLDLEKHHLLVPGTKLSLTIGVQAQMVGSGTMMDVHKVGLAFKSPTNGQNILYAESFMQRTSDADMVDNVPKTSSGKWAVPVGSKAGEQGILEMSCFVAGGVVQVYRQYIFRWVVQETTADVPLPGIKPTLTLTVSKPKGLTPTTQSGCPPPYNGTDQQKLDEIKRLYYAQIPTGYYSSGAKNNAMSCLPGYSHLEPFRCGGYQGKILTMFDKLRFDPDPCVASLFDNWDYGPIQAWFGGHQAVVVYEKGTNWLVNGMVFDPWMNQKPEIYSIKKWASMWSQFKNYGGIGPSTTYNPNYPTHGGSYVQQGNFKMTQAEKDYIKNLPKDQDALWRKMNDTQKQGFLRRHSNNIKQGNKFIAQCPLSAYVIDDAGKKTGMVGGSLVQEIPEVYFSSFPLQDGTTVTQIEYPPAKAYKLVMEGTGAGPAYAISTYKGADPDADTANSFLYTFTVAGGQQLTLPKEQGAELDSGKEKIKPQVFDKSAESIILSLPDIQAPETIEAGSSPDGEFGGYGLPTWTIVAGLCCLFGLGGGVLVVVLVVFLRQRKKNQQGS